MKEDEEFLERAEWRHGDETLDLIERRLWVIIEVLLDIREYTRRAS